MAVVVRVFTDKEKMANPPSQELLQGCLVALAQLVRPAAVQSGDTSLVMLLAILDCVSWSLENVSSPMPVLVLQAVLDSVSTLPRVSPSARPASPVSLEQVQHQLVLITCRALQSRCLPYSATKNRRLSLLPLPLSKEATEKQLALLQLLPSLALLGFEAVVQGANDQATSSELHLPFLTPVLELCLHVQLAASEEACMKTGEMLETLVGQIQKFSEQERMNNAVSLQCCDSMARRLAQDLTQNLLDGVNCPIYRWESLLLSLASLLQIGMCAVPSLGVCPQLACVCMDTFSAFVAYSDQKFANGALSRSAPIGSSKTT